MTPSVEAASAAAATPRPAATLVVLRDRAEMVEVLLTRRPDHLRFMGGAVVFPGGAIEPGDRDRRWVDASLLSPDAAAARLDPELSPTEALAYYVCALRESLEEVGFPAAPHGAVAELRHLSADATALLDHCLARGIQLHTDRLVPAGHWITPLGSPVRFDTHFFVTEAPERWEPTPAADEVAACWWQSPQDALDDLAGGRVIMAPPTIEMLQLLAHHESVEDAVESLSRRRVGSSSVLSTRLSPLVHVVLAPNPGMMTGPGTNTYVVGAGSAACVIDPAVDDPAYLERLLDVGREIAAVVVTHRHADHIGGLAALVARTGARAHAYGGGVIDGIDVSPLADGESVPDVSVDLTALHTPGHASDHICLYNEEAASLFSGDTVLGEGTAVIAPPDGDMAAYMATLRRLRELHIDRIYPGHFRAIDGGTKIIDAYLAHREAREQAILDALASGASSLEDIVAWAYEGTPEALLPAASLSATAHLMMLESAGQVARDGDRWSVVTRPVTRRG